jgi:pimeloyl-ACP methyl ester carboxylesterase
MATQPPHERADVKPITVRSGFFWVPGDLVETPYGTASRGPLYVAWLAPEQVTGRFPLVLVHGGGGQGTDWLGTPDGRPGWAFDLVNAGYAVYVVDRPGHGRSPHHPEVLGAPTPPFPLEGASALFAPAGVEDAHTQWPWGRGFTDAEFAQMYSAMSFFMADFPASQDLDGDRLAALLEQTGPAVLVTHSAGSPGGWLAANRRPDLVAGIVAVEPMGPPFAEFPGLGPITYGLTYAPLATEPPLDDTAQLREDPSRYRVPGLADKPVLVMTGGASPNAHGGPPTVEFLTAVGARAELLHLPDKGIEGNGHGLVFEANSAEVVRPVIEWIEAL